jgi:mediator of DNA damage checkpoint protein 1
VLLPHWFDDAVRLGIPGLDTTPYEWPEPVVLKGPAATIPTEEREKEKEEAIKKATRKLDPEKRALYKTASLWTPDDPLPVPPEPSSSTASTASPVDASAKNVWQGRRVLLSSTLELVGGRREAVEVGIVRVGGVVVHWDTEELQGKQKGKLREAEMVEHCDVFVTRFRTGKAYARVRVPKCVAFVSALLLTPFLCYRPFDTLKPLVRFRGCSTSSQLACSLRPWINSCGIRFRKNPLKASRGM